MPNIETSYFAGKPVTLKGSPPLQGFITEVVSDGLFIVKVKDLINSRRVT